MDPTLFQFVEYLIIMMLFAEHHKQLIIFMIFQLGTLLPAENFFSKPVFNHQSTERGDDNRTV